MVVRMRHTRSKTRMRRSHHALKPLNPASCPKCKAPKLSHAICKNCGEYKGRQIIDVLAKLDKKQKKMKEKELKDQESKKEEPLSAEKLSKHG